MTETSPPPGGTATDHHPEELGAVADASSLTRSRRDRVIGGIAAGVARRFDLDPLVVRVTLVVLGLFGVGVILYVGLWLLLPDDDGNPAVLDLEDRTRGLVVLGSLAVAAAWLIGLVLGLDPTWVGVAALIVGLLLWRRERRTDQRSYDEFRGEDRGSGPIPDGSAADRRAAARHERRMRRAQRRAAGPLLLAPAAALAALACGALGLASELSGVGIQPSAYVAACLAIVGALLLVASRYGRPLLLGVTGFLLAVALIPTSIAEAWDREPVRVAPAVVAGIPAAAVVEAGEYELDVTGLDAADLGGRSAGVSGDLGRILVRVPDDVPVVLEGRVEGAGEIRLAQAMWDGWDTTVGPVLLDPATGEVRDVSDQVTLPADALRLDLSVGFGEIRVEPVP